MGLQQAGIPHTDTAEAVSREEAEAEATTAFPMHQPLLGKDPDALHNELDGAASLAPHFFVWMVPFSMKTP